MLEWKPINEHLPSRRDHTLTYVFLIEPSGGGCYSLGHPVGIGDRSCVLAVNFLLLWARFSRRVPVSTEMPTHFPFRSAVLQTCPDLNKALF